MTDFSKKALEIAIKIQTHNTETDTHFATGVLVHEGSKEVEVEQIDSYFFSSTEQKKIVIAMILEAITRYPEATFVLAQEAWVAQADKREDLPDSLGDLPENRRGEAIIAWVNTAGEVGRTFSKTFTRDAEGKPLFQELKELPDIQRSRFALDLTDKDRLSAMSQMVRAMAALKSQVSKSVH